MEYTLHFHKHDNKSKPFKDYFWVTQYAKSIDDLRRKYVSGDGFIPDGTSEIAVWNGNRYVGSLLCIHAHYPRFWKKTNGDIFVVDGYNGRIYGARLNGRL